MIERTTTRARVCACLPAVLLLSLSLGCATTKPSQEEQTRIKQARSHLNLGIDYLRTGRVALALRELQLAEEADPNNARVQYAMGEAYVLKGRGDEAIGRYRRVLELAPDYHDARLNLAALYLRGGRFEEAWQESKTLADDATFPAPWRALANQGWAEYKLGRIEDARRTLELAREFSPSYWKTLLSLGILEMEQERRLEAITLFREVLDQSPGPAVEAEANYRIGEIYVALGRRDRAVGHLMAAVAQSPDGPWGMKSEEYLKLLR